MMKGDWSDVLRWLKKKRIAVLYGGLSSEKEISRRTGAAILKAFKSLGLKVTGIDADRTLPQQLLRHKIDFCFIALHGRWGEDGTVQGLCEMMGIPYSGSGVLASALSMNKAACKKIFKSSAIPTAPFEAITRPIPQRFKIDLPFVVKPVDGGSAIGVSIVRKKSEIKKALDAAFRYSSQVLVEKFIPGREITAPVLGDQVLPLIEIVTKNTFYDFRAKYVKGMSRHILPAPISTKAQRRISELALKVHRELGCRAFSRIDFILDKNENPWVLELNSIPGMTETSLFPESAQAAGYTFREMLLEMVRCSVP